MFKCANKKFILFKNIILSLILAIFLGLILMISVYCIDTKKINHNVENSVSIYTKEGTLYSYAPNIESAKLDNFTDSLILNIAAFPKGENFKTVIYNALSNPRYKFTEKPNPTDSLIELYKQGPKNAKITPYERYWHGYNVFLKPLLSFYSMSSIRYFNMFLQMTLLLFLLFEIKNKAGNKLLIPAVVFILLLNPISCALCLQYSCIYYITLISSLILLKKELYKSDKYLYFFLWLGILTVYFDMLTYPLTALCFNLVIMIICTDYPVIENLKRGISSVLLWITGYIVMGSSKWFIATILTGHNILKSGFENMLYRVNGDVTWINHYNYIDVIYSNIKAIFHPITYLISGTIIVACILMLISKKYYFKFDFNKNVNLALVAILPFIWYALLQNHSIIHVFYVHRNLAVTIMVILYILISSLHKNLKLENNA